MARFIQPNGNRCLDDEDPPRSVDSPLSSHRSNEASSFSINASSICTKIGSLKLKAQSTFASLKDRFQKMKTN